MSMIKVAIADDHPSFILGVINSLAADPEIAVINSYENGNKVVEEIADDLPDVLLLDIQMPGKTGDELTQFLQKQHPTIKILVLSNFDSPFYLENMMRFGASGYLLKTSTSSTIREAIHVVYNGGEFIDTALKLKLDEYTHFKNRMFKAQLNLTPREKEIVQLLADGRTAQEIAGELFLSVRTVENYRQNILLKLDARNVAELIKKAVLAGIVN